VFIVPNASVVSTTAAPASSTPPRASTAVCMLLVVASGPSVGARRGRSLARAGIARARNVRFGGTTARRSRSGVTALVRGLVDPPGSGPVYTPVRGPVHRPDCGPGEVGDEAIRGGLVGGGAILGGLVGGGVVGPGGSDRRTG
jgi:hypothetical protein